MPPETHNPELYSELLKQSRSNRDFTPLEHDYLNARFETISEKLGSLERMLVTSISNQEKQIILAKNVADRAEEVLARFISIEDKIVNLAKDVSELREFKSSYTGTVMQRAEGKSNSQWIIGVAISVAGLVIAVAVYIGIRDKPNQYIQQPNSTTLTTVGKD